jgi:hypothetical protein
MLVEVSHTSIDQLTMSSRSPHKTTVIHRKHFNLYTQPALNHGTPNHGSMALHTAVPLARGLALYFDDYQAVSEDPILLIDNNLPGHYYQLNTQHLWMGSAMIIDQPTSSRSSETAQDVLVQRIDLAGNEVSDIIHQMSLCCWRHA